jgi:hypothetical protein
VPVVTWPYQRVIEAPEQRTVELTGENEDKWLNDQEMSIPTIPFLTGQSRVTDIILGIQASFLRFFDRWY